MASHPESPIEWWYLTGLFDHPGNRPEKGFEATFFRFKVKGDHLPDQQSTPWAPRTLLSNHAALTSALPGKAGEFRWIEKTRRTFRNSVSIKDHPFQIRIDSSFLKEGHTPGTLHLREEFHGRILDLRLFLPTSPLWEDPSHQLVTGDGPEDRAFYYSYPEVRFSGKEGVLSDRGTVTWKQVSGTAWFDHEWTKSALGEKQAGWIWLGLRLTHGDLMAFQMERFDGPDNHHRGGTYLFRDGLNKGQVRYLGPADLSITPLSWRLSKTTGRCRPNRLRVTIPSLKLEGIITPVLSDQELSGSPPYWEGAVAWEKGTVAGEGYLEMTGTLDPSHCKRN